uniref:Transmembrane protein 18 n=1 Tax=Tetraselmis chuii TaxID=63592 RepID=A0A7S1T5J4_9CHLO|mmetsp:Transcript_6090/g.11006  ORF Transcript_6090/g.11006 Transcript_6090/m.11006 type:complete len:171 (+) Transcript_6090:255-767(+)|eukprot:CAMPEP_0177778148 /NCGR_PEP_ID=MMETSP0491_2-20121128/15789_1 /TAXON_ID=63592 /ORGANISM="Tetraselmis chuii, Strain PLY429" /LENGTH=170 /DNA_ID=CAMNT_0019297381 /DNA_START=255 /DNA_END=767 /DNA_ORIENTATION=+
MADVAEAMKGAFEALTKDIREKLREAQAESGLVEDFMQFAHAVDWTEAWLMGLLGAEVVLFLAVLLFRKNTTFQGAAFFFCAGVVKFSERINSYLATQWEKFATQPYFDTRGVFISAVMSAPLILIMFVILINYLLASVNLLVKMKRKELQYKARQRAKEDGGEGTKKEK